jgi:putative PIN family toxin of toxin-antitoxin system
LLRVILDANLFISYLLTRRADSAPVIIVRAALRGAFVLLLAEAIGREVRQKIATKLYLSARIDPTEIEALWRSLSAMAEVLPPLTAPIPERGRDRKDDYLLALAERGHADYLVTRDKDLLALAAEVLPLRIVPPGIFLREAGLV